MIPNNFKNGFLNELDGRTNIAQVLRARFNELTEDLGGVENLSYQQRSLVERSLWLEYHLSEQEKILASGGDFDSGKWTQAVNALQGIYSKLGLERIKRVQSVHEYIQSKN